MNTTTKRNEKTVKTTAGELSLALYGSVDAMNVGFYEGTSIPVRKIPADAAVTLVSYSGGGYVVDSDGGWIADRFGALGHREAKRASAALEVV